MTWPTKTDELEADVANLRMCLAIATKERDELREKVRNLRAAWIRVRYVHVMHDTGCATDARGRTALDCDCSFIKACNLLDGSDESTDKQKEKS